VVIEVYVIVPVRIIDSLCDWVSVQPAGSWVGTGLGKGVLYLFRIKSLHLTDTALPP